MFELTKIAQIGVGVETKAKVDFDIEIWVYKFWNEWTALQKTLNLDLKTMCNNTFPRSNS